MRQPVRRTIAPQNQLREGLLSLLGAPDLPPTAGWVKVDITTANTPIVADATLFGPGKAYAGTVPVMSQGLTDFYFVEVINSRPMDDVFLTDSLITSVALTNIETIPATVTLEVFNSSGAAVPGTRTTLTLAPGNQIAKIIDEILGLPRTLEQAGGSIRIQSNRRLLALQGVYAENIGTSDYFVVLPPLAP